MLVDLNVWEGKRGQLMSALISNGVAQGLPGCNTKRDGILHIDRYKDRVDIKLAFLVMFSIKIVLFQHIPTTGSGEDVVGACYN